ncbi:MAG: AAA family ATPase, partial [Gemmatimonadetes bacterium]|nr:AAA family ATPase [Gemmatimonadota bacterium]
MSRKSKVAIRKLPSGVPGLDLILGGGIPEYSFNLIAGEPGSGKTTLAHQVMFENAGPDCKALYFTVLGEPAVKMLRFQQQYSFFDLTKARDSIRFVNLSDEVMEKGLEGVLERIVREVEESDARIVVVDSFRSLIGSLEGAESHVHVQSFVQRLALHLTTWQVTSFLVGEFHEEDRANNPVFTIADTVTWLAMVPDNN